MESWKRARRTRASSTPAWSAVAPADFDAIKDMVHHDWVDATLAEQRSASVRALAKKYTIKVESKKQR